MINVEQKHNYWARTANKSGLAGFTIWYENIYLKLLPEN